MDRHYAAGPPDDWRERYVSAYATMHPWEDWAETFAHYLHIRDVLQTAIAYGVTVAGPGVLAADAAPLYSYPAAAPDEFRAMLDAWFPLTYALNEINRSLGEADLYPFVLAPAVIDKLAFIDSLMSEPIGVWPCGSLAKARTLAASIRKTRAHVLGVPKPPSTDVEVPDAAVLGLVGVREPLQPSSSVTRTAAPSTTTSSPLSQVLVPVVSATCGACSRLRAFCSPRPVQKCTAPSCEDADQRRHVRAAVGPHGGQPVQLRRPRGPPRSRTTASAGPWGR